MTIANDWDVNYAAKVISHVDGILTYTGGTGTQPAVGEYILGATSGALGKVLARTGTIGDGTLTLTNVIGQFVNTEILDILSSVDFDTVANGGFAVGDTIVDQVTGSVLVKFIEYNIDGTAGHGTIYGTTFTLFTNNSQLDISGGQTNVGAADGVGVDNDTAFDATVSGTLAVPGTASTNNCVIIHYDAGTIAVPEDAHIQSSVSTAEGYAQQVVGSVTIGSIRVIDSDTTGGAWTDGEKVRILDCVYYDALTAGKVFSEGDVIKAVLGTTPDAVGRVLAVIDDGDSTGKLVLAGFSGTWQDDNEIHVKQPDDTYVKYGEVENTTAKYLDAADINIPSGVRSVQRADQGGIFPTGSLNLVRSANALYSYVQDLYDELAALDDLPPLDGNVKDQLYTVLNDYVIPDLSFRFLEKGSFKDSGNNNVFTNIQTTGAIADIGANAFFYSSSNASPQPDMYVEQDGAVIRQDWLEGNLDVLLKTKTSTRPAYINPTVQALGQLINGGAFTTHVRPYTRTYDSNEVTQVGGVAVVALGNAKDLNNTTGQYRAAFTTGGGATAFTVGEEITTTSGKRGIVTASDTGVTGNVDYALKSGTNLVDTDVITGVVSAKTATVSGAPSNLVAGYGTNIKVMTVSRRFLGGTTTVAAFIIGETVQEATTSATGYILEDDGGTLYVEDATGAFNGTYQLTGLVSGALNTPTSTADYTTVPKDIGGGVGDKDYTAVVSGNITGAGPQLVAAVYEWWKFLLRKESVLLQGGPGVATGTQGRIYRKLVSTFAEVRGASQYGTKAGALVIGAQGVFIEKFTLHTDNIRNIQLIDNLGDTYNPPNLQVLALANLVAGVRGAVYRSAGSGSEVILRSEFKVGAVGGGYNQSANSDILVAAQTRTVTPLPNDVPDTGVLRVLDPSNTGNYLRFIYDVVDRTNNVFSLQQGIGQNTIGAVTGAVDLVADDYCHVVFLEKESIGTSINNTVQYIGDVDLYAVARIKGKKPFKTTATFGSTGVSIGAVLQSDEVVNLP